MIIRPVLLAFALALVLAACGRDADTGDDHGHDHAPGTQDHAGEGRPAAAAAPVTEAVYGDEAPVELAPVAPLDDHGHRHNADGSHPDDDGHDHPHHDHDHDDGDHAHDENEDSHDH